MNSDKQFAREWLRKNAPERVVNAVTGRRGPRRRHDPEAVTVYSLAIFQIHREERGVCDCAICSKVRARLEQMKAAA